MNHYEMTEHCIKLLRSTKREGMEELIKEMDEMGFFTQPASTNHHLNYEGGLLEHSLNVYENAKTLNESLKAGIEEDSIIIASILHDLGKAGQFGQKGYLPNILKSGELSEAKPYTVNKSLLPVDHELRSIFIASRFIRLTEDEQFAIMCHNGLYGNQKRAIIGNETKLYMVLHFADMWASRVDEVEEA